MRNGSVMRNCVSPEQPAGAPELPRVTFAIFAYNQEKYIRAAVEGAFAQSYSPLEIILSDDCSTDQTLAILDEMARHYRGRHRVMVRSNRSNLGTYNHLLAVARESRGELLVVNAGDDISYPKRAAKLAEQFAESRGVAFASRFDMISDDGRIVSVGCRFPPSRAAQIVFGRSRIAKRVNGEILTVPGFAAAYRVDFLKALEPCLERLLIEDGTLSGIINCRGGR
jgi:glycosyltransferase involved in cell wall biosynthesis